MPESPLNPPGSPLFRDRLETKASSWIKPWNGTDAADVIVLGVPWSRASITASAASATPAAMREALGALSTYDIEHDTDLADVLVACDAGDVKLHVTDNAASRSAIVDGVAWMRSRSGSATSVITGGDHSITAPCVEAIAASEKGKIGLIQLDAHMDLRNLDDGGPSNGTPIRQLLEAGTLDGHNVVQIGLHPFANAKAYREVARTHNITQMTARDVANGNALDITSRALGIAAAGTSGIYVTLDMDVLAQAFAPGVPAMTPAGMSPWQLLDMMYSLGADARVRAMDIVEIDSTIDPRRATVRVAAHAMLTFMSGVASRKKS